MIILSFKILKMNKPSIDVHIHDMSVLNDLSSFGFHCDKYLVKTCKKLEKYIEVQSDGSWLWTGTLQSAGDYGVTGLYQANPLNKKTIVVHRLIYHMLVSDIPDGMVLLHKDDNKLSVHPYNFDVGTKVDNNEDMCKKHRQATVFSIDDILKITDLYDSGNWSQLELSKEYNCSEAAINGLLSGKSFPHIQRKTFRTFHIKESKKSHGENVSGAKCNDKMVLEIRAKYAVGDRSFGSLAKEYDINAQTVSNICNRKSWTHI